MTQNEIGAIVSQFVQFLCGRKGEDWSLRGQGPMREALVCFGCDHTPSFMGVVAMRVHKSPSGHETFMIDPLMFKRYLMADGVGYNVSEADMLSYMEYYGGMSEHDDENLAYCNDIPFPMAYMMDKGVYRVNAALFTDFIKSIPKAPQVKYAVFYSYKNNNSDLRTDKYMVVGSAEIEDTEGLRVIEKIVEATIPSYAYAFKITNVSRL